MRSAAEISDRLEIQRNVADFADALDHRRWDQLDQLFLSDARIKFEDRKLSVAEAKAWLRKTFTQAAVRRYLHMVGNLRIALRGDEAESLSHCFVPMERRDGDQVRFAFNGIWFAWRHVRTREGWRIAGSLDNWARPKPDWQPGFYGWATPAYSAGSDWSAPLPDAKG
jgi:hypothetical protein